MATKQELEAENFKMSEVIKQLKNELDITKTLKNELDVAKAQVAEMFLTVVTPFESTEKESIQTSDIKIPELGVIEDCVYLNNKQYKIIHKNSVIDFIDDWRKNYVDDESFVVVINK